MDDHAGNNPTALVVPLTGNEPPRAAMAGAAPVAGADRIKTIDVIRGVALLGILMMNIPGFGINWDFWYTIVHSPRAGKDYYTFAIVFVFFEGTMRGLFSMLFGAGMVLFMMNKKESPGQPPVSEYYYRRLLWLVFFGLINAYVILWNGDILFYYGLCGMILFAFRKLQPKWLLIIGLACVSVGMVKKQWGWNELRGKRIAYLEAVDAKKEKRKLTPEQDAAISGWQEIEKRQKPDTAETNKNERKMRGNYPTVFSWLLPQSAEFEVSYMYHDAWDMLCMMFIGMALFGWGFFSNKLKTSTYGMWMLVGYGIGIPVAWILIDKGWMSWAAIGPGRFVDTWRSTPNVWVEFRRIPLAIGHASLIMLIYRSKLVPWLMRALSNVGQMAFTNYLMQSIICTFFFFGYGLGNYNRLRFHELYYVVFAVWIFQLIFSSLWLHYFRFGPFEWVWRSLTYWKKQPMKK